MHCWACTSSPAEVALCHASARAVPHSLLLFPVRYSLCLADQSSQILQQHTLPLSHQGNMWWVLSLVQFSAARAEPHRCYRVSFLVSHHLLELNLNWCTCFQLPRVFWVLFGSASEPHRHEEILWFHLLQSVSACCRCFSQQLFCHTPWACVA